MNQDLSFVLGLILSLPVGVATNLLTPSISRLLGRVSTRIRTHSSVRRAREDAFVEFLTGNPAARIEALAHRRFLLLAEGIAIVAALVVLVPNLQGAEPSQARYWVVLVLFAIAYAVIVNDYFKYMRVRFAILKALGWPVWNSGVWAPDQQRWNPLTPRPSPHGQNAGLPVDRDLDKESH